MSLLGDIVRGAGSVVSKAVNFAIDHPFQTALLAAGGYYAYGALTAAGAASTAAAASTVPSYVGGGAAVTGGEALAGLGGGGFVGGAPVVPSALSNLGAGIGVLGKSAGKFVTSPGGAALTGTALNVGGSYMAAKGASEDAKQLQEERRQFEESMYEKQRESKRIGYTPYTRGVLSKARSREPLVTSPSQALQMRRAGII